eukprot:Nitzschia sp. Nitz4//scaffold40_size135432//76414//79359//NITZ4_003250-RA/size135432-processed-gene-0.43-mRNA-1//1//CDS//3329551237//7952//frame0
MILLQLVQKDVKSTVCESRSDTLWVSQKKLINETLGVLTVSAKCDDPNAVRLLALLQSFLPTVRVDTALFLNLVSCISAWLDADNTAPNAFLHETMMILWNWALSATSCKYLDSSHARALLAATLLARSPSLDRVSEMLPGDLYTMWVAPVAQALTLGGSHPLALSVGDQTQGKERWRLLFNLFKLLDVSGIQDPLAILELVHYSLNNGPSSDLALLVSLYVRGDALSLSTISTPPPGSTEDDDMDEDDDDSATQTSNVTRPPSTSARPGSQYSKKDLLTMPRLERDLKVQIENLKKCCSALSESNRSPELFELTEMLAKAPWLKWGLQLLDKPGMASGLYVESLAVLLQASTALKPISAVGVLSPLAFNQAFQSKLWEYFQQTTSELALVVFCDLFSHYLVALGDNDFLKSHTTVDLASQIPSVKGVLALDVINSLRTCLFELYWNSPVLASEVTVSNTRGRLLLSGTKLWNVLYERWTRLERTFPFCEESVWWFPHMASRDGDNAVVQGHRSTMDLDEEDMDIDDEDEDDVGRETDLEVLGSSFQDPKIARVLTCIPQALPFGRRLRLFNALLKADKKRVLEAATSIVHSRRGELFPDGSVRERVQIHRSDLYSDSMEKLNSLGSRLKHQIQVSFVNQYGAEEAGIDGGGVFKEFLDDLIKEAFSAKQGSESSSPPLFTATPNETLAVNLDVAGDESLLEHYAFVGRVLAKAVYEGILVEPQFCLPFLNLLLGKTNSMEDLKNYDEEYYKNLNKLKSLSDSDINELGLTFEISIQGDSKGKAPRTVELFPGGSSVQIKSKTQVFSYMHAVSNQLLNIQGARQTRAFLRGFRDIIPASWVRLFSANELQKLIGGDDSIRGIDVAALKKTMGYLGGYHPSQPYIQDFWDILENEFTAEQQRKFLRFMTSCSRQPLLGFGSLEPVPAIQQIRLTEQELSNNSKLPTSQTCFNLLKLPNYQNRALLKEKLLTAVESGAGFELT